jgi:hypothetical protein
MSKLPEMQLYEACILDSKIILKYMSEKQSELLHVQMRRWDLDFAGGLLVGW